jgi:hypothetical protein
MMQSSPPYVYIKFNDKDTLCRRKDKCNFHGVSKARRLL